MIRRFLIASGMTLVGLAAFVSSASAQTAETVDVPFSGFVGSACTFDNISAGVIVTNPDRTVLTSDNGTSGATGGAPGSVRLNCNGSARISVGDMSPTNALSTNLLSGTTARLSARSTSVYLGSEQKARTSNGSPASISTNTVTISGTPISLIVHMSINTSSAIPAGAYAFTVPVTATPL